MTGRRLIALGAAALTLTAAAPASAKTVFHGIHAHRGGPNSGAVASAPENSLEAFDASRRLGADVIELDAKLTADNVPVIMHDPTLDETTNCDGQVRQRTAADLAASCRIDTLGTEALIKPAGGAGVAIPTLADTLAWAKRNKVKLHLEIKNQPTDADYDPTPGFAQTILNTIDASGIAKRDVLIQSFWPPNLDEAKKRGLSTTLLLLQQGSNQQGIDLAKQNGYTIVSPGWPTAGDPKEFVDSAHAAGLPVVPYTIDTKAEIERALDAGVDGLITNDTKLGLRTLYGRQCKTNRAVERRLKKLYAKRLAAYRAQRTAKRRKAVRSAYSGYQTARRARVTSCARARA